MMTMADVLAHLTLHTAGVAAAAFTAFGAMFCRVRQLTLQANSLLAWLVYVAFAAATGWIGLRAVFFGVADPADMFTLIGVWAMLLHTYDAWAGGPPHTTRRAAKA
jgi:hypothetical protein